MTGTIQRVDALTAIADPAPDGLSARDVMEVNHLANWDVRTVPLHADLYGGRCTLAGTVPVEGKNLVIRTNPLTGDPEPLGVVGDRWTPFQNEAVAGLLDEVTGASGAQLTKTFVLDGGRKTGFVLKLPEGMLFHSPVTGQEDVTDLNVVVFNAHDGGSSLSWNLTPVRPFCMNQQRMIERTAKTRGALRHNGDPVSRFVELREMVAASFEYRDAFQREVEAMIDRDLEDEMARLELDHLFGADEDGISDRQRKSRRDTAHSVFGLYRASETVAPFKGTAYGLYNAVTEYTDHFMPVRPNGDAQAARALRVVTSGAVDDLKQRAFAQLSAN